MTTGYFYVKLMSSCQTLPLFLGIGSPGCQKSLRTLRLSASVLPDTVPKAEFSARLDTNKILHDTVTACLAILI